MRRFLLLISAVLVSACDDATERVTPSNDLSVTAPELYAADIGEVPLQTSCFPDAEDLVQRGLALLHHMIYEEARLMFGMATNLESGCAMGYWGRLLFASRPDALSRCLAVITRTIETGLIQPTGLTRASRARTGVVTLIQRFGGALNLNVHLHMIILDQKQPWLDFQETGTLDTLNAASTRYRVAIGPGLSGKTLTLKNPGLQRTDTQPKPFTVDRDGFSLNTAVACQPHHRQRLECLCRYVTRPAGSLRPTRRSGEPSCLVQRNWSAKNQKNDDSDLG